VAEPQLDYLSNNIKSFNDRFGNIDWEDGDRIRKVITEEVPAKAKADRAYQNAMKNSSKSAARLEHDRACGLAQPTCSRVSAAHYSYRRYLR